MDPLSIASMDPASMDPFSIASMGPLRLAVAGILLVREDEADEAIPVQQAWNLDLDVENDSADSSSNSPIRVKPTISAIDISPDGTKAYRGSALMAEGGAFRNKLQDIPYTAIRLILEDVIVPRRAAVEEIQGVLPVLRIGKLKGLLGGWKKSHVPMAKLVYDQEEPLSNVVFQEAQAYTFDVWDLQNLWRPSLTSIVRPFYVQNNIYESLVRERNKLKNNFCANRQVLFFGQHAIEFWECISSMHTQFISDGRLQSKWQRLAE